MSLSVKKSRPLSHEGIDYRYIVYLNSGWYDLTAQIASGLGQKLVAQLCVPIGISVTPKHAAQAISFAIDNGWVPDQKDEKSFRIRCDSGHFVKWPNT
jgi:hypothetical protein